MGATGFEPKAISTISTKDLGENHNSSGAESGAGNEIEKLLKNLTPAKLKALTALLNLDG